MLSWANYSLKKMDNKPFPYTSTFKLTIQGDILQMVLGFRAMRSVNPNRGQEHTILLHATLDMTQATVKPPNVLDKLALSMAIRLQYQQPEKSSGMKLELLTLNRFLKNSNGKSLTMNMQLQWVMIVIIAQTIMMKHIRPRLASHYSQCGQWRTETLLLKS